jgi:hypothetical protein
MAIENEQDLVNAVKNLTDRLNGLGVNAGSAGQELTKTQKAAKAGADGMIILTSGLAKFGAGLAQGQTDFKSFNAVIDTAAGAMGAVAKAIPVFGDALAGALKAAAEGAKFLVGQIDATNKAFTNLAKTGAVGADGMSGVFRQFTRAGLSLEQFQKQVGDNSMALARFRGMTADGAEDFSKIVGDLTQGTDDSLRKLGLNAEQIGEGAAAFVTQQTRLGRSQAMTNEQLRTGTTGYLTELDKLSKVTGMSRDALQKQQDAVLSETRFRSVYQTMVNNGQQGAADQLMAFQSTVSSVSKDTGKGLRDMASGIIDSNEAQALMVATNGKALDIQQRLTSGQIKASEATEELQAALKANQSTVLQQGLYNKDAAASFGDVPGQIDFANAKFDENGKMIAKATATQDAQINKTDKLTDATVSAQKNLEGMSIEINKLGFTLLPQTAKAVEATTKAMKDMVKWVNKELGREDKDLSAEDQANWDKMDLGEKFESGAARAVEGVARFFGADTVAGRAQANRVENESAYLQGQGRGGATGTPGTEGASIPATDVDKILATIKTRESGGNYQAQAKGSSASGAYQFIDSTWQAQAKKSGVGQEFKSAKDAPKEIQDMVAKSMVQDILKQAGGDVSKVPNAWYTGNIQGKMSDKALAANNGLTAEKYQAGWMKDYNKIGGVENPAMAKASTTAPATKPMSAEDRQSAMYQSKPTNTNLAASAPTAPTAGPSGPTSTNLATSAPTAPTAGPSGPTSTYRPALSATTPPTVTAATAPTAASSVPSTPQMQTDLMIAQIDRLDQLVVAMRAQVSASEKLIRMQS